MSGAHGQVDRSSLSSVLRDLVKPGDENLREMNKKLQNMLEEQLTKNMHLQKVCRWSLEKKLGCVCVCVCEIGTGQSQPLNGKGKKGGLLLAKGIERQATLNIQSTEMEMAIYAGYLFIYLKDVQLILMNADCDTNKKRKLQTVKQATSLRANSTVQYKQMVNQDHAVATTTQHFE